PFYRRDHRSFPTRLSSDLVTAAINQTLYENVDFDLKNDFEPVSLAVKVPNVLVVNPNLPVNSFQELIDHAKENPGTLNFASSGSGTSIHMAGELFRSEEHTSELQSRFDLVCR